MQKIEARHITPLPASAKNGGITGEPVGTTRKRGPFPKLQQHMERISQLPKPRQRMVMEMLEAVLAQGNR